MIKHRVLPISALTFECGICPHVLRTGDTAYESEVIGISAYFCSPEHAVRAEQSKAAETTIATGR